MSFIDRADININLARKAHVARKSNSDARSEEGIDLKALRGLNLSALEEFVLDDLIPAGNSVSVSNPQAVKLSHDRVLAAVRKDAFAGADQHRVSEKAAAVHFTDVEIASQESRFIDPEDDFA